MSRGGPGPGGVHSCRIDVEGANLRRAGSHGRPAPSGCVVAGLTSGASSPRPSRAAVWTTAVSSAHLGLFSGWEACPRTSTPRCGADVEQPRQGRAARGGRSRGRGSGQDRSPPVSGQRRLPRGEGAPGPALGPGARPGVKQRRTGKGRARGPRPPLPPMAIGHRAGADTSHRRRRRPSAPRSRTPVAPWQEGRGAVRTPVRAVGEGERRRFRPRS